MLFDSSVTPLHQSAGARTPTLAEVVPGFLLYAQAELRFAPQSLVKYRDCLRQVQLLMGDAPITEFSKEGVIVLKAQLIAKSLSISRQVSILAALKRLLHYCREQLHLPVLDPGAVLLPRRPRRHVVFMTPEEVAYDALLQPGAMLIYPMYNYADGDHRALLEQLDRKSAFGAYPAASEAR